MDLRSATPPTRCELCRQPTADEELTLIHLRHVCPRCAPTYRTQLRWFKWTILGLLGAGAVGLFSVAFSTDEPPSRGPAIAFGVLCAGVVAVHFTIEAARRRKAGGRQLEP